MFIRLRKKGQSTLEYAALIACIVAALIIIQRYYNRAAQGKWKAAADQLGEQFDYGKTQESYSYSSSSESAETLADGAYTSDIKKSEYEKTGGVFQVDK